MAARDLIVETIKLDDIYVVDGRRDVDAGAVSRIAGSIASIGLRHPITVRYVDTHIDPEHGEISGAYLLVAGRHRMEAARSLEQSHIECEVVRWTPRQARKWEIAEWIAISEEEQAENKPGQLAQVSTKGGRGNEGGLSAAARDLGVERTEARRAVKIAAITPEAKNAAREAGLDDNQSALLKVARAEPARQADTVREIAEARALKIEQDVQNRAAQEVAEIMAQYIPGDAWDGLKANLHAAGKVNLILAAFNNLIGQSVMDRRYGTEG